MPNLSRHILGTYGIDFAVPCAHKFLDKGDNFSMTKIAISAFSGGLASTAAPENLARILEQSLETLRQPSSFQHDSKSSFRKMHVSLLPFQFKAKLSFSFDVFWLFIRRGASSSEFIRRIVTQHLRLVLGIADQRTQ
jgi:hypothetical protein